MSEQKIKKSFKEYYNDPEYRKKHLAKVNEKIKCECGQDCSRGNLAAHKKTSRHNKSMLEKKGTISNTEELITNLENILFILKNKVNL